MYVFKTVAETEIVIRTVRYGTCTFKNLNEYMNDATGTTIYSIALASTTVATGIILIALASVVLA